MRYKWSPRAPWESPDAAALAVFALHISRSEWIVRRTDRALYVDDRRVDWDTTFEVLIPSPPSEDIPPSPDSAAPALVDRFAALFALDPIPLPLIVKQRALLKGFDLRGENGEPVRTLTWEETKPLLCRMLNARATALLDAQALVDKIGNQATLSEAVASHLEAFAEDEEAAAAARQALEQLATNVLPAATLSDPRRQARVLLNDSLFKALLDDLTVGFLVIAVVQRERGSYRTFRLHHHQDTDGTVELRVGGAGSYHAEIRLPRGVAFGGGVDIEPTALPPAGAARAEGDFWRAELDEDLLAIHAKPAYPEASLKVNLLGSICNPSSGLVERTVVIAIATAAMFSFGVVARLFGIHPDVGAAAPILAAIPAAYALLVLQDSRSRTHEAVVRGPQRALRNVAGLTFLGASVLAADFPHAPTPPVLGSLGWGYRAGAWTALTLVGVVYAAWIVTRGRPHWCGT